MIRNASAFAPEKVRLRKSLRSSSGASCRSSSTMNAANETAATASAPTIMGELHP